MAIEDLPTWDDLLRDRGTSRRGLSRATGVDHGVISRALRGENRPTDDNARKIADGLNISAAEFWERYDAIASEAYEPPESARYLTNEQRNAVTTIIKSMARANLAADKAQTLTGEDQGERVDEVSDPRRPSVYRPKPGEGSVEPIDFAARRAALEAAGDDLPPSEDEIAERGIAAREGETEAKRREREGKQPDPGLGDE